ncbi:MAG TPA: hypothetical protein VJQ44_07645 [Gemmatimonadales bacterium]|nr:hypothetical protein [Gemmatimonadales bacterium]
MWSPRATVPAVLALAALACGGDDGGTGPGGGNVQAGRFTAKLSGGFSQTLSGTARYIRADDGFTIVLSDDSQGSNGIGVVLSRGNPTLPAVDEYRVVDATMDPLPPDDFFAASFWRPSGTTIQCFSGDVDQPQGVGGSLNITGSGSNLEGDFTTEVGCLELGTGQLKSATITGEFNAEEGSTE